MKLLSCPGLDLVIRRQLILPNYSKLACVEPPYRDPSTRFRAHRRYCCYQFHLPALRCTMGTPRRPKNYLSNAQQRELAAPEKERFFENSYTDLRQTPSHGLAISFTSQRCCRLNLVPRALATISHVLPLNCASFGASAC